MIEIRNYSGYCRNGGYVEYFALKDEKIYKEDGVYFKCDYRRDYIGGYYVPVIEEGLEISEKRLKELIRSPYTEVLVEIAGREIIVKRKEKKCRDECEWCPYIIST